MNFLKFNQDFSYKYLTAYPTSTKESPRKVIWVTITLWKVNNRLSYLRCWLFLQKFFNGIRIKHLTIKFRVSKIHHRLRFSFEFHENFDIFFLVRHKLPEPEIRVIAGQYILTYNFYRFVMEVPIKLDDHYTAQKISQLLPDRWQNI